jgi:hypothetical protein
MAESNLGRSMGFLINSLENISIKVKVPIWNSFQAWKVLKSLH